MMAFDATIGGVVLYGGWDGGNCSFSNQTWEFRNGVWLNLTVPGLNPGPLWDASAASDGRVFLVVGGNTVPNTGYETGDTWKLA